ncbi:tetratricopeptide repeat protein [Campylobacter sp. RM16187]|uniref:tetratricopeptide repeat protein n=1 Tax=Campylobacter sp. RM16187 TaxID=1660063 RepID=UPI0021B6B04C|nr:tetratricopeptide repeat protein [Campylobacter sp. RM16187]QKG29823.1 Sel1 domain-containing protein [Campylobacter sp. RM16187]
MKKLVFIVFAVLLTLCAHARTNASIANELRIDNKFRESIPFEHEACVKDKVWSSCKQLGSHYDFGRPGVASDPQKAIMYYKMCCDLNNQDKMCCEKGYAKELAQKYEEGCKANDAASCGKLAIAAYNKKDFQTSFKYAKKGCDIGKDEESCVYLASMYYYGDGVEKDYEKAFEVYSGLCERGVYNMCPTVGFFYADGIGVKQDIKKSKEILEKICPDKYPEGCTQLGVLYETDKYGMKDEKKATELFSIACKHNRKSKACERLDKTAKEEIACENKDPHACYMAANAYQNDPQKMLYYYDKACEYGYSNGCFGAAALSQQDAKKAMEYAYKACKLNSVDACEWLTQISTQACQAGNEEGCKWLERMKTGK